jgi:hypothetical protein
MSRRTIIVSALVLVFAAGAFSARADRAVESDSVPAAMKAAEPAVPIPANHPFGKIQNGMNEVEVRKILGEPTSSKDYMTGKQFLPWNFGRDASRQEWTYKGKGLITFSRNAASGSLKVIKVIYDPSK